jgi:hypothetical protein
MGPGLDTKQARTEEMGLCVPGDLIGATTYSFGQGDLHYSAWHTYSQAKQAKTRLEIIAAANEASVTHT